MPPHSCDIDALRVARRVEAEAFGLVAVRGVVGDSGKPVPPGCRRALELGTAGVAVPVDLCPLAGLPLGRRGLCQVGDGYDKSEDVRSDHGVGYLLKMGNNYDLLGLLDLCQREERCAYGWVNRVYLSSKALLIEIQLLLPLCIKISATNDSTSEAEAYSLNVQLTTLRLNPRPD